MNRVTAEQVYSVQFLQEFAPDKVSTWPESMDCLQEDFSIMIMLYKNIIAS